MFQRPESLDSLIEKVDTTNMTPHEHARMAAIRGLAHFENGEYDQSIKELEKAEIYFLNQQDDYHLHISKLIKAFTFEYLNLDHNAAGLYVECEKYFDANHQTKFKFYATLGLFRMARPLNLDKNVLLERLQKAAVQLNDSNYSGMLHATMGVLEKNDSLKSIYYEKAKSALSRCHRWSRVYAIDLNLLFVKIRKDQSKNTQLYYDDFNKRDYPFIPTARQRMRYKYGQAYLYAIQGKDKISIEVANQVLIEAMALNIASVEVECVKLLANLYKRTGDFANAHQMLERYHSLQKKDLDELQQIRLLALGAHYRYSVLEREKLELKVMLQKLLLIIGVIILILMLVSSIWLISWKKSKYQQEILKLKNRKIEDQISHLLLSLNNTENRNEYLIKQVELLKIQHNDSLKISEFLKAIDQNEIKTWMEYESLFHELRPGWIEKLKQAVPELTPTDLKYCICLYFNLNNYTIANLCNTGVESIKGAKKRIRDKFALNDATEIYLFLKSID